MFKISTLKTAIFCTLAIAPFVSCSAFNDIPVPSLKFDGMKGNVARAKTMVYSAKESFGDVAPDELEQVKVEEYDKDGNVIKTTIYAEDGKILGFKENFFHDGVLSYSNSCDKYEDKCKETIIQRDKNYIKILVDYGDEKKTKELIYKDLACCVKIDGIKREVIIYNKKGQEIEHRELDDKGGIYRKIVMEYDKNGNPIKWTMEKYSGFSVDQTFTYLGYDEKGNWVTMYVCEGPHIVNYVTREITYRK